MLPITGRFYVHGSSPRPIVSNTEDYVMHVQLWQIHRDESGEVETTNVYVSFDKSECSLDRGLPLPEGGTIIRFLLPPGQSLYACSDDQGRGGYIMQKAVVGRG